MEAEDLAYAFDHCHGFAGSWADDSVSEDGMGQGRVGTHGPKRMNGVEPGGW